VLADGSVSSQLGQGLQTPPAEATTVPVTVYTAAKIVTMERGQPTANAVAVAGKRIVAAGSLDQVKKVLGTRPYTVDETFRNKVVMPGFIDQHLHPILGALTLAVEVIAPEAWNLPGRAIKAAEAKLAAALQSGGFLQKPQVTITLVQVRTNQVSVLGQVARPGRFPLDTVNTRASDMLASAGGVLPTGDDLAILTGTRNGKPFRAQIDIPGIFLTGSASTDTVLQGGDTLYVHRAPVFYIYGEAQRAGSYRIERDMTVMQAMAQGGGPTNRGSENRLRLHRRTAEGQLQQIDTNLSERVLPNDVLYIKESIF
jgi:polysaccharide export outer membrane protein